MCERRGQSGRAETEEGGLLWLPLKEAPLRTVDTETSLWANDVTKTPLIYYSEIWAMANNQFWLPCSTWPKMILLQSPP